MPIFDLRCPNCFEEEINVLVTSHTEKHVCPKCKGAMRRLPCASTYIDKTGSFYRKANQ